MNGVVLVTGMPGAGKTTVSRLLAQQFPRAAHLEGDAIQDLIVSGGRHPDQEPKEEAYRQLRLRTRNVALLADSFAEHGVLPVIDDLLAGRRFEEYAHDLRTRPLRLVVLDPPLDVAERRDVEREEKQVFHLWRHLHDELVAALHGRGLWIDNSQQSPTETVDEIVSRSDEAVACA